MERSQDQLARNNFFISSKPFSWLDLTYKAMIVAGGLVLVFFTILLKSKTTADFIIEPYFFTYAVFVTSFELSRIFSAMFYERSLKSLMAEAGDKTDKNYEPSVTFVIPCKNEERDIEDSIKKIFEIDYPENKIEIIVINDGSTDGTLKILRRLQRDHDNIFIIDWPNQGKRWAMAAGFKLAKGEIVIQMDSDSEIVPETFRNLIQPFKNKEISAVCAHGVPKNADQNVFTKMQAAYYFMSFRILKAAESTFNSVFCLSGCCSAYRRSAVMPVLYDWLSESFLGKLVTWGDDRALTSWLLKNGGKTIYAHDAVALTIVPDSFKKLLKQQLRWKKSWLVNATLTSRFIWKRQPFVAFFYYFPLIAISLLSPIMTFRALFFMPISHGTVPLFHVIGILLVTGLIVVYYRYIAKANRYWPYLFLWSLFNLFILSFVIVWAAFKIQDRGWGTR